MKQGIKKFNALTQGARSAQGQKEGELFLQQILEILNIEILENKSYTGIIGGIATKMKPDFIIKASETSRKFFGNIDNIFLESKFKQIPGSDWEKIESNFGYHNYFYNNLSNLNIKTVVILSGYWRRLQKNYVHFMKYFQEYYGYNVIFDFGDSVEEIYRFANLMDVKLDDDMKTKISKLWIDNFYISNESQKKRKK